VLVSRLYASKEISYCTAAATWFRLVKLVNGQQSTIQQLNLQQQSCILEQQHFFETNGCMTATEKYGMMHEVMP